MARDEINAFLGAGTSYQGTLNFQGSVRIDGSFTGEIRSEGTLVVGREAKVEGEVHVGQLVLSGHIEGSIIADKKVVLHKTADLIGSLNTPVLVIEEGAKVEGQVTMSPEGIEKARDTADKSDAPSVSSSSSPSYSSVM